MLFKVVFLFATVEEMESNMRVGEVGVHKIIYRITTSYKLRNFGDLVDD